PLLCVRNMRWLNRRLAISHMLQLSATGAVWERLHRLHAIAEEQKHARIVMPVFVDGQKSSVRTEYAQALLLELSAPDSLSGRGVELAFRIARRVSDTVQVEPEASPEASFAVLPMG